MAIKSIVAVAGGTSDDLGVVAVAAGLARRMGARLIVLPDFSDSASDLVAMGQALGARLEARAASQLEAGHAASMSRIAQEVATAGRGFGLTVGEGDEADIVVRRRVTQPWRQLQAELPLADLVVLSARQAHENGQMGNLLAEALIDGRTPVLAVREPTPAIDCVMAIAWDGSAQAGHAVRGGLPLLLHATEVIILRNVDDLASDCAEAADPRRLAAYLRRHGVQTITTHEVTGGAGGEALYDAAMVHGARVLVAGAFGHSRVREALLGGATRTFLKSWGGPHVLLAH